MSELEHLPSAQAAETPAISDAIERLLANPELLSNVAAAIGLPTPAHAAQKETSRDLPSEKDSKAGAAPAHGASMEGLGNTVAALAPLLSGLSDKSGAKPSSDDPRACLLRALKPYVNRRRADAIDTMIRLAHVSEIMKKLNEKGG